MIYESYPAVTDDGYKLNIFRIKAKTTKVGAPVVFFQHGVMDSADCWILNYFEKAPAFVAASAGYDVWLGNQRGTKHSPDHVSLNNESEAYWDFSYTKMGQYDAPTQINTVLQQTGRDNLTYVGHSQGTTEMFFALQDRQDYWKDKINLFVAAAPVTRVDHTTNQLIKLFSSQADLLDSVTHFFGIYYLMGGKVSNGAIHACCGIIP